MSDECYVYSSEELKLVRRMIMKEQKESIESIIERAPKEATHYTYPDGLGYNEVFFKIDKDMIVESAWISNFEHVVGFYEDCGYYRTDYEKDGMQPYVNWDELVELTKNDGDAHSDAHSKWMPDIGEIVLFKRTDSIDYAYDSPEKMEVVAIVGDKVWLKSALRDIVTNLDNITPLKKEKTLRERLVEIMSSNQQNNVDVYCAADRLIEAGVKLEKK